MSPLLWVFLMLVFVLFYLVVSTAVYFKFCWSGLGAGHSRTSKFFFLF